ncbi:2-keto-4-pentenoate hydratase [Natrialbaceae archaeon A-arb3/5]
MTIDPADVGATLHHAYADAEPVVPSSLPADLNVESGYAAQDEFVERRIDEEGPVIGYKIGFTSEAVRSDLGVDEPAYGRVLAETVRWDRCFETSALIEPRIEPEIAFVLDDDLGPGANRFDVAAATAFVVPVIEVVDSRVQNWDLTAPLAVADNALAGRLLPGDRAADESGVMSLAREGVEVLIDGERRATGTGAAVLGHPADAIAWLAAALAERGRALEAGDVVTTGSITEPIPVSAGETVVARFSSLGTVVAQAN